MIGLQLECRSPYAVDKPRRHLGAFDYPVARIEDQHTDANHGMPAAVISRSEVSSFFDQPHAVHGTEAFGTLRE